MTTIDALKQLQKRLREATGPDRELDAEIAAAFLGGEAYHQPAGYEGYIWVRRVKDDLYPEGLCIKVERYTTDPDGLGACVALMREVLPGWSWQCGAYPQVHAHVAEPVMTAYGPGIGVRAQLSGATVPLAFLSAIIAAKIAELDAEEQSCANTTSD